MLRKLGFFLLIFLLIAKVVGVAMRGPSPIVLDARMYWQLGGLVGDGIRRTCSRGGASGGSNRRPARSTPKRNPKYRGRDSSHRRPTIHLGARR